MRIYILLSMIITFGSASAQTPITFEKNFSDKYIVSKGGPATQTFDGGYIVAGSVEAPEMDIRLIKTNSVGDTVWTKIYSRPGLVQTSRNIIQTKDSGYVVVGSISGGVIDEDLFLLRVDKNGTFQWTNNYVGFSSLYWTRGYDVKERPGGGYMALGLYQTPTFGLGKMFKINSSGTLISQQAFGADEATGMDNTPDKGYVAACMLYSSSRSAMLVKTDSTGTPQWNKQYQHPNSTLSKSYNSGNVKRVHDGYVMGCTVIFGPPNYKRAFWLIKTDLNGDSLWTKTFLRPDSSDQFVALDTCTNGGYVLTGENYTNMNSYLIKTDSNGNKLWEKNFGGQPASIEQTKDKGYIVGGAYYGVYLAKLDSNGCIKPTNAHITGGNISICQGTSTTLNAYPKESCSYSWSTGATTQSIVVNQAGTYSVLITHKSCGDTAKPSPVTVTVLPIPTISAGPDLFACLYQNVQLNATGSGPFVWDPPSYLSCTTCASPTGYFSVSGSHFYTVTDSLPNGCKNSDTVNVYIYSQSYILPVANFSAAPLPLCGSGCVTFTENCLHTNAWQWTFQGGTPSSSTFQNPGSVCFSTPGNHPVTLSVSNDCVANGDSKVMLLPVLAPGPLPVTEKFESTFPATDWSVTDDGNDGHKWEQDFNASGHGIGASCVSCNNSTVANKGTHDRIITPLFDMTNILNAKLFFDVAYARYDNKYFDSLAVYYSVDCGNTWTMLYQKGGSVLATAPDYSGSFIPASNEWRTDTISLSALNGLSGVVFAFENRSGQGNFLYLDNINISSGVVAVHDQTNYAPSVSISPNPFLDKTILTLRDAGMAKCKNISLKIIDTQGRKVRSYTFIGNEIPIEKKELSSGIYFYHLFCGENLLATGKLIVE